MTSNTTSGNILGSARAENDLAMLQNAFVETPDYQALTNVHDFNFVVGRRGTGKSALYIKLSQFFRQNDSCILCSETPMEYECLEFQNRLSELESNYRSIKSITRVAWRANLLINLLQGVTSHYKFKKLEDRDFLDQYRSTHKKYLQLNCFKRCTEIINSFSSRVKEPNKLPGAIALGLEIERLQSAIQQILSETNRYALFLFDGLDEGWYPKQVSTALLGGLAAAAADLADKQTEVHVILFVRDNIFRALGAFDPDFSRHIEGSTLRLHWDEASLFYFICRRLRVSLDLQHIENDNKVWNRFGQRELKDREGFKKCLASTLYRPRDLLVLLNNAFILANRQGRHEIIQEDTETASKQISKNRIDDLLKEYDTVFPGLEGFVDLFKGAPVFRSFADVATLLQQRIDMSTFETQKTSDFALLNSGREAFFALYSIGLLGLKDPSTGALLFCHDGSPADLDIVTQGQETCIHPCYWKALSVESKELEQTIIEQVYDDYRVKDRSEVSDLRMKLIGQLIAQLPQMSLGEESARQFEEWVLRTVKILFAGKLVNPELHPNKDAIQRRDIVATNMAKEGFWRRVLDDYSSRQVIFEVKNYADLKPDDFRQALSYATGVYGHFIILVTRSNNEGLTQGDRGWVKEMYDGHGCLVFVLPAHILSKCVSKLRRAGRFEYTEHTLVKRLDTFCRSYLSLRHVRGSGGHN